MPETPENPKHEALNPKPEARDTLNPISEARDLKPEARNPKIWFSAVEFFGVLRVTRSPKPQLNPKSEISYEKGIRFKPLWQ